MSLETIMETSYFFALLIVIISIIISKLVFSVFKKVVSRITKSTKTTLDERILDSSERPIEVAIILAGIYIAIQHLQVFSPYWDIVSSTFKALGILVFLWLIARVLNGVVKWYSEIQNLTRVQKTVYFTVRNIFYIVILSIGAITMLHLLGIEMTPIVASLGIGGLAVALALQSTLSNYFAGLYIAADGSIKIGDYIETSDGLKGYVEKISWRSTKVRTLADNLVIVPNAKLAESILTNYYDPTEEVNVILPCGVAYGSDLEKVEKVTLEVAKKLMESSEGGVKTYEPRMRYTRFGDSNIEFNVVLRSKDFISQYKITHEFIKELDKAYKKHGIEISWPVRKVYLQK